MIYFLKKMDMNGIEINHIGLKSCFFASKLLSLEKKSNFQVNASGELLRKRWQKLQHAEAFGVVDRLEQPLFEFVARRIFGQQKDVEAGVTRGQAIAVGAMAGDDELQFAQTSDGDSIWTFGKIFLKSLLNLKAFNRSGAIRVRFWISSCSD